MELVAQRAQGLVLPGPLSRHRLRPYPKTVRGSQGNTVEVTPAGL